MFLIPKESKLSRIATAFCSYHDKMNESGIEFKSVSSASAKAVAILIAECASLHCPTSINRGNPATSPNSSLLKRYLPQASVSIMLSFGTDCAKSV